MRAESWDPAAASRSCSRDCRAAAACARMRAGVDAVAALLELGDHLGAEQLEAAA